MHTWETNNKYYLSIQSLHPSGLEPQFKAIQSGQSRVWIPARDGRQWKPWVSIGFFSSTRIWTMFPCRDSGNDFLFPDFASHTGRFCLIFVSLIRPSKNETEKRAKSFPLSLVPWNHKPMCYHWATLTDTRIKTFLYQDLFCNKSNNILSHTSTKIIFLTFCFFVLFSYQKWQNWGTWRSFRRNCLKIPNCLSADSSSKIHLRRRKLVKKVLQQKSSQQSGVQSSEKNSFTTQLNLRLFQQLKLFPLFSLSQKLLVKLVLSYKKMKWKNFFGN